MGQHWQLLNLDRRQSQQLGKLGEVFFYPWEVSNPLTKELTRIELLPPRMDFRTLPNARPPHPGRPQPFAILPIELIAEIFEHLDCGIDCFCLAVASRMCWSIGAKVVQQRYLDARPSRAGDRIIVIGGYAQANDLPEGLYLTPQEQEELRCNEAENPEETADAPTTDMVGEPYLKSLSELADLKYSPSISFKIRDWSEELVSERRWHQWKWLEVLNSLADEKPCEEHDLVLRNLSRQQFVRASAYANLKQRVRPGLNVNLGLVVFSRICWSWDPSVAMVGDNLHRGVWAGDRFDIVTAEAHDRERLQDPHAWIDVGNEAVQELEELYRVNYELKE